jgi:hypothetical protein
MCGIITLLVRDQEIEIEILCADPLKIPSHDNQQPPKGPFRPVPFPNPPIDWQQLQVGQGQQEGPSPVPWQSELTQLGHVLAIAGRLQDSSLADRLGIVAADIATSVAAAAAAPVRFGWTSHSASVT